jgi:hypothetical protein
LVSALGVEGGSIRLGGQIRAILAQRRMLDVPSKRRTTRSMVVMPGRANDHAPRVAGSIGKGMVDPRCVSIGRRT